MPSDSRKVDANTVRDMPATRARSSSVQSFAGASCMATIALRRRGWESPASMPPFTSPVSISWRSTWIITTSNRRFTSAVRPQRWVKASSNSSASTSPAPWMPDRGKQTASGNAAQIGFWSPPSNRNVAQVMSAPRTGSLMKRCVSARGKSSRLGSSMRSEVAP